MGSSPRGRGTRQLDRFPPEGQGLIPAWAGNTVARHGSRRRRRAHPRVGGEHSMSHPCRLLESGSSPRGRGTLADPLAQPNRSSGSSPRGRGTLPLYPAWPLPNAAHPRVGGEHATSGLGCNVNRGLIPAWAGNTRLEQPRLWCRGAHPRVGGEHPASSGLRRGHQGSSPRGRGTHQPRHRPRRRAGLIPAWAGNTRLEQPRLWCRGAHPRVGGEHLDPEDDEDVARGSSPRGRGTHPDRNVDLDGRGLIPAWAGNTAPAAPGVGGVRAHPRVGGEHMTAVCRAPATRAHPRVGGEHVTGSGGTLLPGSSPRGRGTLAVKAGDGSGAGLIPAWAGNTASAPRTAPGPWAHPRVGGEHVGNVCWARPRTGSSPRGRGTRSGCVERVWVEGGSSPRGRGTRVCRRRGHGWSGLIPAWAGNTRRRWPLRLATGAHPRVGGEHWS